MAKGTKKKKLEEVISEPEHDLVNLKSSEEESQVVHPDQEPEPQPEVPEVVQPEPVKSDEVIPIQVKPPYRKELDVTLSIQERLEAFLEGRSGVVKLNDFLKSLYPLHRHGEQPHWSKQGNMKALKSCLVNMQAEGKIRVVNNMHLKLGQNFYKGDQYLRDNHNLATVDISVVV
jgi:hypothetical protein